MPKITKVFLETAQDTDQKDFIISLRTTIWFFDADKQTQQTYVLNAHLMEMDSSTDLTTFKVNYNNMSYQSFPTSGGRDDFVGAFPDKFIHSNRYANNNEVEEVQQLKLIEGGRPMRRLWSAFYDGSDGNQAEFYANVALVPQVGPCMTKTPVRSVNQTEWLAVKTETGFVD